MFGMLLAATLSLPVQKLEQSDEAWVVGSWLQDVDEDGPARDEILQLDADGSILLFDKKCRKVGQAEYFIRDHAVFVVATTQKGRVSLLYEIDRSSDHLRFTSARTLNLATYARMTPTCDARH